MIDSTNYHAKHRLQLSLTLHRPNLRPELTRKGLCAHFYFRNDMIDSKSKVTQYKVDICSKSYFVTSRKYCAQMYFVESRYQKKST